MTNGPAKQERSLWELDWLPIGSLTMSVIGLSISAYLTASYYLRFRIPCFLPTTGCRPDIPSSAGLLAGIAVPFSWGNVIWFSGMVLLAGLRLKASHLELHATRSLRRATVVYAAIGLLGALYLLYRGLALDPGICELCATAHFFIVNVFVLCLVDLAEF